MIAEVAEVAGDSATRFGILLGAVERGNHALAADMLVSIPAADLLAIEQRLAFFDIDLRGLLKGSRS